jgi:hypothetical protein
MSAIRSRRCIRFQKGKSGNPGGRPKGSSKDLAHFGDILTKEFYKKVPAQLAGKVVNKIQGEILAMQMMKAAINGKMCDRRLLLQFIEAHVPRLRPMMRSTVVTWLKRQRRR